MKNLIFALSMLLVCVCTSASAQSEKAVKYWKDAIAVQETNPKAALKFYAKAIKEYDMYGYAYYYRAKLKKKMGDNAGALEDYNNAAKLSNGNTYINNIYSDRGILKGIMGDKAGALADYTTQINANIMWTTTITENRPTADVFYNRGNWYLKSDNYEKAVEDFSKAVLYDTKFAEAHYARGLAYLSLKKDKEGCEDWKKAVELGNKDAVSALKDFCK